MIINIIVESEEDFESQIAEDEKTRKTKEEDAKEFLRRIENETPLNKLSFRYMAEMHPEVIKMICSLYLKDEEYDELNINIVKTEFSSYGRGKEKNVRYDLYLKAERENVVVDVEAQKRFESEITSIKRARFYACRLTTASLKDGGEYKDLEDVMVIYLVNRDILESGKPYYVIKMHDTASKEVLKEYGETVAFANLTYRGDDEYGKIGNDFNAEDVSLMNEGPIKEAMMALKGEDEEENMKSAEDFLASIEKKGYKRGMNSGYEKGRSKGLSEGLSKGITQGFTQGISEEKTSTIERMLKTGRFTFDDIAYASNASLDQVRDVASSLGL